MVKFCSVFPSIFYTRYPKNRKNHNMAAIPVTIVGTMTYSGLEVGGGPLPGGPIPTPPIYYPPAQPPGIWGGPPLHPTHPIAPGGPPPGIWGPPSGFPTPPIYLPEPPAEPPSGGDGRWVFVPGLGWVWAPSGGGDKPHPPQPPVDPNAPVVTPH